MIKAFLLLITLALFDSVDPFPTGATVFLFGRKDGGRSALKYLFTAMTIYITVGIVFYLLIGLHILSFTDPNGFFQVFLTRIFDYLNTNISYAIQILIGLVLVGAAIWQFFFGRRNAIREVKVLQANATGGIGKIVSTGAVLYLPSAIPFLVAITALISAGVPVPVGLAGIVLYVVLYMTFPIILNILRHFYGEKAEPAIEKIRAFINKFGNKIIAVVMLATGIILIVNAILFFTGSGQSFLLPFLFRNYGLKR